MSAELLAPAGDFETALAAFDAGADAVYCGLASFSARAFARNFTLGSLKELLRVARAKGKKTYVAFNTLVDEGDMDRAVRDLAELAAAGPDAVIVQDLGIARMCRKYFPSLALHASTQLAVHNLAGVNMLKELGFSRVVPARELSAEEIEFLARRSGGMEFECFIHGALCYSVSGLCLFSAMEKGRSGNRGECAYCCRLPAASPDGRKIFPFSMKDLRLGEDVRRLVAAGAASLKIEGRMKSALYVASAVRWYREILDGARRRTVSLSDLETVFSRRTTKLYLDGRPSAISPVDPDSLGHLGAEIGTVKRVTRDREGRAWMRFHTSRALERHDGIQIASPSGGKPLGFGIALMRGAISRAAVFEVAAGADVEVFLPEDSWADGAPSIAASVREGDKVYCSMSNAVKRMFPPPSYRAGDFPGCSRLDATVEIFPNRVVARADGTRVSASVESLDLAQARNPESTPDAVRKAFSKLGGTDFFLGAVKVFDPQSLFVPPSVLNGLRRNLVDALVRAGEESSASALRRALDDDASGESFAPSSIRPMRVLKLRPGQTPPGGEWDETVWAVDAATIAGFCGPETDRIALPVFTPEKDFAKLRIGVKRLARRGYSKWEAADLATLGLLRECGIEDITADWTLYAMNASALRSLSELGVRRFAASPENGRENIAFLSESGYAVEFLSLQSVPLFMSLAEPGAKLPPESGLAVRRLNGLWITTRREPTRFDPPRGRPERVDISWS